MELEEHVLFAQSDQVEQLHRIFGTMHKHLRNYPLIYHENSFHLEPPEIKDPNMFSIINTISTASEDIRSLYKDYPVFPKLIMNELGFGLELKSSKIRHAKIKNGVYLRVKEDQPVRAGTVIGFVPGSYRSTVISRSIDDESFMPRMNGEYFNMNSLLPYPNPNNSSIYDFQDEAQVKKSF